MPNNENRQNDGVHAGPAAGKETRGHGRPDHARKPGDAKRFGSKPSGSFKGRTDRKTDRAGGARNGDKPAWKRANDGKPARTPRPDGRSDWHRTEGAQDADRPRTGAERPFGADRPPRPGVANVHGRSGNREKVHAALGRVRAAERTAGGMILPAGRVQAMIPWPA